MTVYIVDLEKLETRYTKQWASHVPKLITQHGHDVVVISGPDDIPSIPTPGMFLNFSATNVYKAVQVEKISRLFCEGKIKDGDYFLFTDAWHPGVINLKYMIDLLGINAKIGGLWHAGSYDKWDGLGRLVGNKPWVRHAEKSFFYAFDHNYFATQFHITMFYANLLNDYPTENPWFSEHLDEILKGEEPKIVRTGWPMEYMEDTLTAYKGLTKRDLILFPHRIAPEKQVDIFRDLATHLPQYEFVVCQDQQLSKHEYHTLLGESKMVFSANLQETLGISWYEGAIVDSIPMVPDRLSYSEMAFDTFKYPSKWTESFEAYSRYRPFICKTIIEHMENYKTRLPMLRKQTEALHDNFFSASELLANIK
jgi:hypothetical protein